MSDPKAEWEALYHSIDDDTREVLRIARDHIDLATTRIKYGKDRILTHHIRECYALLLTFTDHPMGDREQRGRQILRYVTAKRLRRTCQPLMCIPQHNGKVLPLNDTTPYAVGNYVVIVFGHRQPVEIAASNGTHICVKLPGGHGVKWYTREQIERWNQLAQEVQAA